MVILPESNDLDDYSYGHIPVITGYKWDYTIIHSINGVLLVLITDSHGHNCMERPI